LKEIPEISNDVSSKESLRKSNLEDLPESITEINKFELRHIILTKQFLYLVLTCALRNTSSLFFLLNSKKIGLILF